jgi:hypothetical protein
MIKLTEKKINESLAKAHDGLCKYYWIQTNFQKCDVSRDRDFQKRFNGFYRVRRNAWWRSRYYKLMQKAKNEGISFAKALRALRDQTGRIEASFVSKLIATVDPSKPVIDKFVLDNLGLRLPYHNASNRESRTIEVYRQLCAKFEELVSGSTGRTICEKFQELYPWAKITDLKKIDLALWQIRDR